MLGARGSVENAFAVMGAEFDWALAFFDLNFLSVTVRIAGRSR